MRVVYVSPVGTIGGAERVLLTAMAAVKRAGHDVRLISCADGPLLEQAAALGVPAVAVPMPAMLATTGEAGGAARALLRGLIVGPKFWRYARRLRRAVDDLVPDVVHSNGLRVHVFLGLARPAAPVVWHLHDFVKSRRLMRHALRRVSGRATRAIAISRAVRDDAAPVVAPLPIDVVLNAIDTTRFAPRPLDSDPTPTPVGSDSVDLDALTGLPPSEPATVRVGLVATYARWKGQDVFLRAAARARQLRPDLPLRFHVVGGPIYRTKGSQWDRDELVALARSLGLAGHVGFVPFQPDAAPVYRALDVVVHASTQPEPFGLTIVEAMASRRPVVVARAGGAAEIVTDDVDALTFTPGDDADLAAKILDLAADPARRDRLAAAARAAAVEKFSDTRLGAELVAVYDRTVAHRPARVNA